MCKRPIFKGTVLLFCNGLLVFIAGAQPQIPVGDWKNNPYRGFIGSWCGKIVESIDKTPPEVKLTIVEERVRARMRWNYSFGVEGRKDYYEATKYVVMSPKLGKMLMHFDPEPDKLYEAPELATFAQNGYGTFTATIQYSYSNYFHIRKIETDQVTFNVGPDSLSYVWHRRHGDKDEIYSNFQLKRIQPGERCN